MNSSDISPEAILSEIPFQSTVPILQQRAADAERMVRSSRKLASNDDTTTEVQRKGDTGQVFRNKVASLSTTGANHDTGVAKHDVEEDYRTDKTTTTITATTGTAAQWLGAVDEAPSSKPCTVDGVGAIVSRREGKGTQKPTRKGKQQSGRVR